MCGGGRGWQLSVHQADRLLKGKWGVSSGLARRSLGVVVAFPRHQPPGLSWELANPVVQQPGWIPPPTCQPLLLKTHVRESARKGWSWVKHKRETLMWMGGHSLEGLTPLKGSIRPENRIVFFKDWGCLQGSVASVCEPECSFIHLSNQPVIYTFIYHLHFQLLIYHLSIYTYVHTYIHAFTHPIINHSPILPLIYLVIYLSIQNPYIYLSINPSVHHTYIHLSIHPPVHSSIHQSIHIAIYHLLIHLSTHMSIHLTIYPAIYPFICSSIYPSTYPSFHPLVFSSILLFIHLFINHPSPTHHPSTQEINIAASVLSKWINETRHRVRQHTWDQNGPRRCLHEVILKIDLSFFQTEEERK